MYEENYNNAKDWAKTYTGESVMYEGIATYHNESIYLSKDTLKKCMPELKGRPVIIEHKLGINPSNMEDYAVGYVTKCEYNNETGDFDCDFVVWDEEAKSLLKNDYTLSTSYIAKEFANGGTFINTPYDKEVTKLSFTHLAIVKNPRYEKVKVYQNSLDIDETDVLEKMSEFENDITEEKETIMSEKIEVEQSFLTALLSRVQELCNSKKEEKAEEKETEEIKKGDEIENEETEEKDVEDLDDAVEKETEEKPEEKSNEVDEELEDEELENSLDDGIDWFEKMQEVMNSAGEDEKLTPPIQTREQGLEKGKKIYG